MQEELQKWMVKTALFIRLFEKIGEFPRAILSKLERTLPHEIQERLHELYKTTEDAIPDPFGMDLKSIQSTLSATSFFYTHYFRCQTEGIENIPDGPAILAANHAGQIPIDAMMVNTALLLEATPSIQCRSMMDRMVPSLPLISSWYAQLGVVLGTEQNAQYLLANNQKLLTFPEGIAGIQKPLSRAYELQNFGFGFARLALKYKVPIIPISIVGSEEQYPTLYNVKRGTHLLNVPSIPIWLHMPIPILGLLPLPAKYFIHFGQPIYLTGDADDDDDVIGQKVNGIKETINANISRLREQRKSVFF